MVNAVSIFPCSVVVSPYAHWRTATPDRKVYLPDRQPCHRLLEVKCPNTDNLGKVKCLANIDDKLQLKKRQLLLSSTNANGCD